MAKFLRKSHKDARYNFEMAVGDVPGDDSPDFSTFSEAIEDFGRKFEEAKPKPLTFLGISAGIFTSVSVVSLLIGREKATLGTVSVFGIGIASATYYLRSIGIDSVPKFSKYASSKIQSLMGGSIEERAQINEHSESDMADLNDWNKEFEHEQFKEHA
ncbi:hypothetical protein AYI68_g4632 [Smittium mucronatum]|uniref:Uncharacterized protein n=1 Tax=Smittium mucronatum TaxID=133383 RepID=A0A1R0GSI1_9FUNG|nr:hypothetical protein AYI68_g6096 [Smittium mucronatum]OLY81269.1 hypothetical protein AYI68_g4632 [Smittium mucronatum]